MWTLNYFHSDYSGARNRECSIVLYSLVNLWKSSACVTELLTVVLWQWFLSSFMIQMNMDRLVRLTLSPINFLSTALKLADPKVVVSTALVSLLQSNLHMLLFPAPAVAQSNVVQYWKKPGEISCFFLAIYGPGNNCGTPRRLSRAPNHFQSATVAEPLDLICGLITRSGVCVKWHYFVS